VDDDSGLQTSRVVRGYQPVGVRGLEPATKIHWSAKAGNASVWATASDAARWMRGLFFGRLLSETSRRVVLEVSPSVGYGWFRGASDSGGPPTT
jgi:hypothetical protein